MSEPEPLCIYEKRDPHIAIIRLNRPEKKNAISRDLYWALDEAWQKAKADDDVWSIILTGSGGRLLRRRRPEGKPRLCQGRDEGTALRSAAVLEPARFANAQTDHRRDQWLRGGRRFQFGAVLSHPLLRARHRSSAAQKCAGRIWRPGRVYVCQLPTGWAYWFALTGQMIDADTAFRLGLVQKICEPDKLIDDCVELCTTINRNGRLIAAHTVEYIEDKLLYEIQGWEKGFEVHREFYAHLRQSKDYDEGSAAFSERRKPEFTQEYYDGKTKPPGVP